MKKRKLLFWIILMIALCLVAFVIPISVDASSISELQSEIEALEEKNRAFPTEEHM